MSKKYIVANWKMQPNSWAEAEGILDATSEYFQMSTPTLLGRGPDLNVGVVLCPPFVFLEEVGKVLQTSSLGNQAELGAQDVFWEDRGADTGEISGPMLNKLGVRYVIVGHSERRWKLGESDDVVNQKIKSVLRNTMVPIVCVGERIRDENHKEFLKEQVNATFAGLSADEIGKCMIAYEPVWAISSNPGAKPDTPNNALESVNIIRDALSSKFKVQSSKFLYGGSITSANAHEFLSNDGLDGVLVGGASVNKEEFVKILSLIK